MPLGIRPTNDMAFKKTFGTPENKLALISVLNAILNRRSPIVDVTIENPYNLQDFETDKLSILDIKAVDQSRRIFNIEMQLTIPADLLERLVFYACEVFADQLKAGDEYAELNPVYTICLIDGILWKDATKVRHRFQLCDLASERVLHETLEIHTLELGRYNLMEADLKTATTLECWLFWLLHADEYELEALLKLFPEAGFQQATRALAQISEKTEDKAMYDSREKALRDFRSAINSAAREARLEGKLEGEREGEERGTLMGRIGILEEILGSTPTTAETLRGMSLEELTALASELQQIARGRSSS